MVNWPRSSSRKLSEPGADRPQPAFLLHSHPTRGDELVEVLGVVLRNEGATGGLPYPVAYFFCKYGDGTEVELPLSAYLHTPPKWYFEHEITTQPRVKR